MNVPLANNMDIQDTDLVPTQIFKTKQLGDYYNCFKNGFQMRPRFRQSNLMQSKIKKMRASRKPALDGPYSYQTSEFMGSIMHID